MKPIVFLPEAEQEFETSIAFYENRRAGLGGDFRSEVDSKIGLIRGDPLRWPLFMRTDARKCRLKRFPFHIIYYDTSDQIWVVAVAHDKRKPGYWRNRRPFS